MRNPKALQLKARQHQVIPLDHNTFSVKSASSDNTYQVRLYADITGGTCSCRWGETRQWANFYRSGCSHVQSVFRHLENLAGRETSTWADNESASKQHRVTMNIGDNIIMTTRKVG